MPTLAARVTIQNNQHAFEVNYQKSTNKLQLRDLDNLRLPHTYLTHTHNFFWPLAADRSHAHLAQG